MITTANRLRIALLKDKHRMVRIYGESMFPLIHDGDMLLADCINREIQIGDIVLLEHDEQLICHRIIEILPNERYRTKGDHNLLPDNIIIERRNIIALVNAVRNHY